MLSPMEVMGLDRRTIYTAASDGTVISWDSESGRNDRVGGKGHGVQVSGLVGGSQVQTIGYDDTLRTIEPGSGEYSGVAVSLSAQPKAIDSKNDLTFVCTMKSIVIIKSGSVLEEVNVEYEPSCCAFSATHNHLVVGEAGGNMLRVYSTVGGSTDLVQEITLTGSAMDLSFSPDQKYLVSADSNRKVTLFTAGTYEKPTNKEWGFHTAKVNCVAWAPPSSCGRWRPPTPSTWPAVAWTPPSSCGRWRPLTSTVLSGTHMTRVRSPAWPGWTTPAWSPLGRTPTPSSGTSPGPSRSWNSKLNTVRPKSMMGIFPSFLHYFSTQRRTRFLFC